MYLLFEPVKSDEKSVTIYILAHSCRYPQFYPKGRNGITDLVQAKMCQKWRGRERQR